MVACIDDFKVSCGLLLCFLLVFNKKVTSLSAFMRFEFSLFVTLRLFFNLLLSMLLYLNLHSPSGGAALTGFWKTQVKPCSVFDRREQARGLPYKTAFERSEYLVAVGAKNLSKVITNLIPNRFFRAP